MAQEKQQKKNTSEIVEAEFKDVEGERQLLAYILKKKYLAEVSIELFTVLPHKLLLKAARTHKTTLTKLLALRSIAKSVKQTKIDSYKAVVKKVYETEVGELHTKNIKLLIEHLQELRVKRERLIKADEYIQAVLQDNTDDVRKLSREISLVGVNRSTKTSGDLLEDYKEREKIIHDRKNQGGQVGIPIGLNAFDAASGGLMLGEMMITIGESSIGKSMFLENFGLFAWLAGFNVNFISIEMSKHEVQFRADARLARINLSQFRLGNLNKKDFAKWRHKMTELENMIGSHFHIDCLPRQCTPEDVEESCEKFQDKYGVELDLVVPDYLNIMGMKNYRGSTKDWNVQADIAWGLKGMCADFNNDKGLALITGGQIKDEDYGKKELSITSLKYGRAISELFPIIFGLVRDDHDKLLKQMHVLLLKLRNLKELKPILVRPNYDIAMINDESRRVNSLEDL